MQRDARRAALAAIAGLLWVSLAGFRFQGNPGDCLVNDSAFTSADGGCRDNATDRVWSSSRYDTTLNFTTHSNSVTWCSSLVEGGQSDWRMPTIDEMQAVAANGAATHLNIPYPDLYDRWSSTTRGNKAWVVNFMNGAAGLVPKAYRFDTVCVR